MLWKNKIINLLILSIGYGTNIEVVYATNNIGSTAVNTRTLQSYLYLYDESIKNNSQFWHLQAIINIDWFKIPTKIHNNKLYGAKWFEDGHLNACYNSVDRHANTTPNKIAIIYDGNQGESTKFTYKNVLDEVMKIANILKNAGLKKGDTVVIYMSMCPESVFSMLACARLGLVHNVVFGGFSATSLQLRISDSNAKFIITQESAKRGEKNIDFMKTVSEALIGYNEIGMLLFDDNTSNTKFKGNNKIIKWSKFKNTSVEYIPCVSVNAEDNMFYLYTSGSTGKPKGIIHTTGGYMVYATLTTKLCFDIKETDVFCCTADIGWITGHSYSVYGPLSNGITTVILGGLPFYPSYYRLFEMIEKHGITQLYTAPTVIRTLKQYFSMVPIKQNSYLGSLRILGSVGEPINTEAYNWYKNNFNYCPIVDTYWQTETGGVVAAPIPGVIDAPPECAALPLPGQTIVIARESESTPENVVVAEPNELGLILFKGAWPGISRGIIGDMDRFKKSYFKYDGYYFTGDEGYKDSQGNLWVRGRNDDVINVSGHRISTAEVESASCKDNYVAEAAVVAVEHTITGQSICIFIVLKDNGVEYDDVNNSLKATLRKIIGSHINPSNIYVVEGIPKTATGKIMRRVLRNILTNTPQGDLTTCVNLDVIDKIKQAVLNSKK